MLLMRENPNRTPDGWGFEQMPSRVCPVNDLLIEWIYVVDLDLNVFRVSDRENDNPLKPGAEGTQYFRLDNIPRYLFTPEKGEANGAPRYPVMSEPIPAEHFATNIDGVTEPDLALYDSGAPPPEATFPLPSRERSSTWRQLQLELIREFVQYFVHSFHDSCPSRTSSPFVFRQIAYAVLCLTSRAGMKFHRSTTVHLLYAEELEPMVRTPWWEPPDTDTYWLGDILIVLDQHLCVSAPCRNTNAAIARAVQLAPATPTTAVIFSVHAVLLVHIVPGEPIRHTAALPLFTLDPTAPPFTPEAVAHLDNIAYATPGVLALLDLFTTHARIPHFPGVSPALLPAELWYMVFHAADKATQEGLEASCRFFRALAVEYPRLGGRTLFKWGPDDALQGGALDGCGWQVGLWGREKVCLNMPLVRLLREGGRVEVRCEDLGIYLVRV